MLPDDPSLLFVDVGLTYVPGVEEYHMVIKTPKTGWEGQCRRLVLIVAGMESHFHDFKFK